jgi:quinol monooxygenase YgiN
VGFGTIGRYRVKPGHEEQFVGDMASFEQNPPPGWIYHTMFRSTKDPNEIWVSVVFENEEAYRKNASSPEMDKEYHKMLGHLQGEPEWHDGHVIHEGMRKQASS